MYSVMSTSYKEIWEIWLDSEKMKGMLPMRNRSMAIVIRDNKILMEKVFYFNRYFYTIPGGGIEEGETPEKTALRELKEECGLDGKIVRPLAVQYKKDGSIEYSFEVDIPANQSPILGYDPEVAGDEQAIKEVCWCSLDEISERDKVHLWAFGLAEVGDFIKEL